MSGALDAFSDTIRREQYLAANTKGDIYLDSLVKYANQYVQAQQDAQFSFFGMDAVDIHTPPIPSAEPWSNLERLNRERELVGIYLSAHPLDEYSVVLQQVCNLRMEQMSDLTPLADQDVKLGGIVTALREGVDKRGAHYGIATLEDYSGSGELRFFNKDWASWGNYLKIGSTLYITGHVQARAFVPNQYELRIGKIDYLSNVKDDLIESITIHVDIDKADEGTLLSLVETLNENQGKAKLYVNLLDGITKDHLSMQSRDKHISVCKSLIDFLENSEALSYRIN